MSFTLEQAKRAAKRAHVRFDACLTPARLRAGMNVELEHRDVTRGSATMTAKIAAAHLREHCDYYARLRRIER